jgi:drug/metabolite transporter (DMT)-like permease
VSARAWAAFAACSVIWGLPYLFIKVAVDDGVPPVFVAWARLVLGAVVLLALAWRAGTLGHVRGRWRWIATYGIVELAIPFPLIALGEQEVASSLAAIIIAAVPLFIALLALRFDRAERAQGMRLVGLFVGLGGVVALMGIDVAGRPSELLGALAILGAALGYAIGPMLLNRKLPGLDPRAVMGAALVVAAVALTPFVVASPPTGSFSADAVISLIVLGVVCTAAGLVLFAVLIGEVGPGRASVITYVNPLVAVALGVAVLGERPGAGAVAGLLLILAGSWLSTDGRLPPGVVQRLRLHGYVRRTSTTEGTRSMRARQLPTLAVTLLIGVAGIAGCGEDDVEDAARDAGNTAEDVGNQAKDEAGEVKRDVEREIEE